MPSLSARRAWIEIKVYGYGENKKIVALRKESVDRNADRYRQLHESYQSLSARRAWIEILRATHICRSASVALRKESVDRNGIAKSTL